MNEENMSLSGYVVSMTDEEYAALKKQYKEQREAEENYRLAHLEPGYYWVKRKGVEKEEIAEIEIDGPADNHECWYIPGHETSFERSAFKRIGERILQILGDFSEENDY